MSGLFFFCFETAYCKFSRNETLFSRHETVVFRSRCNFASEIKKTKCMDIELVISVALAAGLIVIVLVLVIIIIYQRWRIGDQNVFIERFIHQNEEQRQKMRKAGII